MSGVVTATVMFTDMVGSTALRTRLGDAVADEVMASHDRLLDKALETHGGLLVKRLGDGVLATFSSAVHALHAAVDVQRAVETASRHEPVRAYALRVGVSAGDISVVGEDDVAGLPVVEAARLCAAAEGGQVMLSAVVRALVGSRAPGLLVPAGEVSVRGAREPLVAHRLQWSHGLRSAAAADLRRVLEALAEAGDTLADLRATSAGDLVDRVLSAVEQAQRELAEHVCNHGGHLVAVPRQSCA